VTPLDTSGAPRNLTADLVVKGSSVYFKFAWVDYSLCESTFLFARKDGASSTQIGLYNSANQVRLLVALCIACLLFYLHKI